MRPRSRTITRRAMLTTVLMGATAALLTEATRPALALTPNAATPPVEAPKQGTSYTDAGQDYYEQQYKQRAVRGLERRAKSLGFDLVPTAPEMSVT